jgi:hypothetical protein
VPTHHSIKAFGGHGSKDPHIFILDTWIIAFTLRHDLLRGASGTHWKEGWVGHRTGEKIRPRRESNTERSTFSQSLIYLAHNYMQQSHSEANSHSTGQEIPPFLKPKDPLPCSQPANGSYHASGEPNPRRHSTVFKMRVNRPIILWIRRQSDTVSLGFPTTSMHAFLISMRATCPEHLTFLDFAPIIICHEQHKLRRSSWYNFIRPPLYSSFLDPKYSPRCPLLVSSAQPRQVPGKKPTFREPELMSRDGFLRPPDAVDSPIRFYWI